MFVTIIRPRALFFLSPLLVLFLVVSCSDSFETSLDQTPQAPERVQGVQGVQGPKGETSAAGKDGLAGSAGAAGAAGAVGMPTDTAALRQLEQMHLLMQEMRREHVAQRSALTTLQTQMLRLGEPGLHQPSSPRRDQLQGASAAARARVAPCLPVV